MNEKDKKYIESLVGSGPPNLSDYDGDGYPDIFDCNPFDPKKDGAIGQAWDRLTRAAQTARSRIYRPAAASGREAVSAVYHRAYGIGAATRAAAATRIHQAREFVRAPPTERARRIESGKESFIKARKPKQISDVSRRIHEGSGKVARAARGFETRLDPHIRDVERALGFHKVAIPKPARWAGEQAKQLAYGIAFSGPAAAVEMAGMVPGGVETIARKPSILPAAVAVGAFEMGRGMWHGATTAPVRTAGEFISMGAISKGVPKIPVPSRVSRVLPRPEMLSKDVTPAELAKLSPAKQIKYKAGVAALKGVHRTPGDVTTPLEFTKVKAFPGKSGLAVEQWIRAHPEQKPIIGGSGAASTQMARSRTPGDIDLHVETPKLATQQLYKALKPELGEGVRVKKGGIGIETRDIKTGEWHHAVDVLDPYPVSELIVPGLSWTTRPPPIEIGGIKYATIGEQMMRKASQALQIAPAKGRTVELGPGMMERKVSSGEVILGPKAGRVHKDVYDFMDIGAELSASRKAAAESSWLFSGYKTRQAAKLQAELRTYETHAYMYPDPIPAVRGYYGLPSSVRTPGYMVAAVGIGAEYPTIPKYPTTEYPTIPKYPTTEYPPLVPTKPPTKYPPLVPTKPPTKYPPLVPTKPPTKPPTMPPKYPPPLVPPKYPPPKYPPPIRPPPPITPPIRPPVPPLVPPTKPPVIPPRKKDKKKTKERKAKPELAIGWKQRHELITLQDFLGYKL